MLRHFQLSCLQLENYYSMKLNFILLMGESYTHSFESFLIDGGKYVAFSKRIGVSGYRLGEVNFVVAQFDSV